MTSSPESEFARVRRQIAELLDYGDNGVVPPMSLEDGIVHEQVRAQQAKAVDTMIENYQRVVDQLVDVGVHPAQARRLVDDVMTCPCAEHDEAIMNAAQTAIDRHRGESDG